MGDCLNCHLYERLSIDSRMYKSPFDPPGRSDLRMPHLGRLGGHLEAALEDGEGEVRGGVGRQPQSEVVVRRRVVAA